MDDLNHDISFQFHDEEVPVYPGVFDEPLTTEIVNRQLVRPLSDSCHPPLTFYLGVLRCNPIPTIRKRAPAPQKPHRYVASEGAEGTGTLW